MDTSADKTRKVALVTGITGQDGSYLAELLLDKGYEVSLLIWFKHIMSSNFQKKMIPVVHAWISHVFFFVTPQHVVPRQLSRRYMELYGGRHHLTQDELTTFTATVTNQA